MARIEISHQIEEAVTLEGVDRKVVVRRFTPALVRALNITFQTLVEAPGVGKAVFPLEVRVKMDGAVAFTSIGSSDDLRVIYAGQASTPLATIETTGFLNQTDRPTRVASAASNTAREPLENTALQLITGGALAAGSALIVTLYYREIDL